MDSLDQEKRKFHPLVIKMANLMQDKLDARLKKYPTKDGIDNWLYDKDYFYLINHLQSEFIEFKTEIGKTIHTFLSDVVGVNKDNLKNLYYEAADVCNLLGMLCENIEKIIKDREENPKKV